MKTIWKSKLRLTDEQVIIAPEGAIVLKVGMIDGALSIWYECEDDVGRLTVARTIYIRGTGHPTPTPKEGRAVYIDTVVSEGFAWHIFRHESDW